MWLSTPTAFMQLIIRRDGRATHASPLHIGVKTRGDYLRREGLRATKSAQAAPEDLRREPDGEEPRSEPDEEAARGIGLVIS